MIHIVLLTSLREVYEKRLREIFFGSYHLYPAEKLHIHLNVGQGLCYGVANLKSTDLAGFEVYPQRLLRWLSNLRFGMRMN